MSEVNSSLRYKRICLKLSGEAMSGRGSFGIDMEVVNRLARDVGEAVRAGVRIVVVLGGGNIFRGLAGAAKGIEPLPTTWACSPPS